MSGSGDAAIVTELGSLLEFLSDGPTAAHAVAATVRRLEREGFVRLDEAGYWSLEPGERFFCTRGGTSIVAGIRGDDDPAVAGFRITAAHTDFPTLRLKPKAESESEGYRLLRAEIYGGPLLSTWFDRDLGLAGRLWVREAEAGSSMREVLFRTGPVCRIPTVAIHLDRKVNEEGFRFNREDQVVPVLGLSKDGRQDTGGLTELLASSAGVEGGSIASSCIDLYDLQGPSLGGLDNGFLFSARIDNLAMCHAGLEALIATGATAHTCVLALFDSEEVGSRTSSGAYSNLLPAVLERIACSGEQRGAASRERLFVALARSLMLSADGAHAVHPSYRERHEASHRPVLNAGPVLKVNAAMRYSTDAVTSAYFAECAKAAGVPFQELVMRNDRPCGTTIGPILASSLGIRSVDAGNPMLSMHSVREMAGTEDHGMMISLMREHFAGSVPCGPAALA